MISASQQCGHACSTIPLNPIAPDLRLCGVNETLVITTHQICEIPEGDSIKDREHINCDTGIHHRGSLDLFFLS